MTISLTSVDDLQEHLLGVLCRSDHHAGDVNEVLLAIAGAILWRKSPNDPVKVNTKDGAGGNVIWFRVDGNRYALTYSHEDGHIKLMRGGRNGDLIQAFTNENSTSEVARVFAGLGNAVPELSKSRKVHKEGHAPRAAKDPLAKEARLQAKSAMAQARDEKIAAHREQRRAARAAGKAADKAARAAEKSAGQVDQPGSAGRPAKAVRRKRESLESSPPAVAG